MPTIQFNTVVNEDQIIRPPSGITLPQGEIEVTVRPREPVAPLADTLAATRDWLLAFAVEAEQSGSNLPPDLAANHDHYAHGKPRS